MVLPVRYARSGEVSIAYAEMGAGPADIVYIPGFASSLADIPGPMTGAEVDALARFARVVLFDKRGTGLSERSVGIADLETRMDDVRAVMDAVGLDAAHLLGNSEGGPMSLLFAATYPDRVLSLGLAGTFARFVQGDDHPWMPTPEEHQTIRQLAVEFWGTGQVAAAVIPEEQRTAERIAQLAQSEILAASPLAVGQLIDMDMGIDVRSVLPTISVPTLVIHAIDDNLVPVESGRYLAEHIPGARLVEFEQGGHATAAQDRPLWMDAYEEMVTGHVPEVPTDRVLATVLFTDIVDSTALAAEHGDADWRRLLDAHDATVRREVEAHRGVLVKSTGDGALARFDGPGRAVACAQAIASGVAGLGLATRSGAHTGEVVLRGDDVGGIAVHIASRVADRAKPGEVLVSRTVKDLTAGSGLTFEDRGEHELKGVPDPWQLYAAVG